jgi:16S rRNA (guanine527-N7)-methyltransferase
MSADPVAGGPEQRLRQRAGQMDCALSDAQIGGLLQYLELLQRWNKVYNLTAVRDPAEMLSLHLIDSLAVLQPLRRVLAQRAQTDQSPPHVRLLDVGSGGGLPGVVLAICQPELQVSCVDAVGKKAAFVAQVAATLKLANLRGIHARVEALTESFDVVCSRAFASLADFTAWSDGCLARGGVWMAMKGKHPADEIAKLPPAVQVFHVEQLAVAGLDAERCIVWMRRAET